MTTESTKPLHPESGAVMKYLDMYQGIISRMASDCKKWAVALISAIFLLVADDGKVSFVAIAWIPAILFCFLDAYYLALEKQFRAGYSSVVKALHAGKLHSNELYIFKTDGKVPDLMKEALFSWAVFPFYLGLLILVNLTAWLV